MGRDELIALAKQTAAEHNLYPAVVCAICERESSWNPWSMRFEPGFERRYIHPALPESPTTEELTEAISFGLMQIMGEVARERGFTGKFLSELCDPATGLEFGCRHFSNRLEHAGGDVGNALLLWNGGGNPAYAQQVLDLTSRYS